MDLKKVHEVVNRIQKQYLKIQVILIVDFLFQALRAPDFNLKSTKSILMEMR